MTDTQQDTTQNTGASVIDGDGTDNATGVNDTDTQTDTDGGGDGRTSGDGGGADDDGRTDEDRDADKGKGQADREKRYRLERNEARKERDALQQNVVTLQRQMIDAEVERAGFKPTVLWANRKGQDDEVSGLCRDDGSVDHEAVRSALSEAVTALGLGPRAPRPDATLGQSNAPDSRKDAWAQAFAPGER
ncbi:hypothetical protein [Gordonia alkanivorans]|uniref:hypothetical protein n=1 Tax=Gordonia alkanivorans TaxID=84096 RepID=UPI002447F3D9|nr:hypothetical protein [Gordonia alkanivorans]MDH3045046.1 hypothetical protein [Gordonia alkanivorans]